jgi:predicted molibdopterin-dependent oxidoreductase YjgC
MLADPADTVVLLPAMTRYEQPGGGTETSTERRIYYSPEVPGPRIGEARAEWRIFMDLAERVKPDKAHLVHADSVRDVMAEIARAVPSYDGIQHLARAGDQVQWGGRLLCEDGRFPTEDGRAHFAVVEPPEDTVPAGHYLLSTRRGKQFNSMVQADRDPLTGARRTDVLISQADAGALRLASGDAVLVRSKAGELQGRALVAPIKSRNVQVHWPEGNVLLERGACDPQCGIPDYNTYVELIPLR